MESEAPIAWLTFFTLAAVIVVLGGFFLYFLRSRYNRAIAAEAIGGRSGARGAPTDGAGYELFGLLGFAVVVMVLLVIGHKANAESLNSGQGGAPAAASSETGANNQLATPREDPNTPKPYQPQNPAPDQRSAVTGSSTGMGANSGGHPEAAPGPKH